MRLIIAAIGTGRRQPEHALAETYMQRLPRPGTIITCESRLPAGPGRKADEAAKLLAQLPMAARLAVLDPKGRETSSEDLAELISRWRDAGVAEACFAIGGADGHGEAVLARADARLAFGSQTWPHMLFRAMLAEQLYRAEMILLNHPYHRG